MSTDLLTTQNAMVYTELMETVLNFLFIIFVIQIIYNLMLVHVPGVRRMVCARKYRKCFKRMTSIKTNFDEEHKNKSGDELTKDIKKYLIKSLNDLVETKQKYEAIMFELVSKSAKNNLNSIYCKFLDLYDEWLEDYEASSYGVDMKKWDEMRVQSVLMTKLNEFIHDLDKEKDELRRMSKPIN